MTTAAPRPGNAYEEQRTDPSLHRIHSSSARRGHSLRLPRVLDRLAPMRLRMRHAGGHTSRPGRLDPHLRRDRHTRALNRERTDTLPVSLSDPPQLRDLDTENVTNAGQDQHRPRRRHPGSPLRQDRSDSWPLVADPATVPAETLSGATHTGSGACAPPTVSPIAGGVSGQTKTPRTARYWPCSCASRC